MIENAVEIRTDDRVRLMSAVIAATNWPEKAQAAKGHLPHMHARNTAKRVAEFSHHPAVNAAQVLLDQSAPLEALYTYVLKLSWPDLTGQHIPRWVPPKWDEHLRNFYEQTKLAEWWSDEEEHWHDARMQSEKVFESVNFYEFLRPFLGDIVEQLVFMPNISYPSERSIGVRVGGELISICPPRIAWGENPPWPFDDDPGHVYTDALSDFARLLMLSYLRQNSEGVAPVAQKPLPVSEEFRERYPTWGDQFTELFVIGVVALFLEQAVNKQEAKAYILMSNKAKGLKILPGVVSVLRRYLSEFADGKYQTFIEYLPRFPNHLRVAKTISAL
jgi:hypothetical protein